MMHPFFEPLRGKVYPPDTPDPAAVKATKSGDSENNNDDGAEPNDSTTKRGAQKVQADHDEAFA